MTEEEKPLVPKYILKKLILLYGFNKEINSLTKSNHSGDYYLINAEWLDKFKSFYNYNKIINLIIQYNYNWKNYLDCRNNIEQIVETINPFQIFQNEQEFPEELIKRIPFCAKIEIGANKIYYHNNFYIVNSELNELLSKDTENNINKNYPNFINKAKSKFFLGKNSFLLFNNNIEICEINNEGMFITKYCIKLGRGKPEEEIYNIIKNGGLTQIFKEKKIDKKELSCNYDKYGGIILNIEIIKKEKEKEEREKKEKEDKEKIGNIQNSITNENINDINNNKLNKRVINNNIHPLTFNKNINEIGKIEDLTQTRKLLDKANINLSRFDDKTQYIINKNKGNINKCQIHNNGINLNNNKIENNQFTPQNNYNQEQFQFQNNVNNNYQNNFNNISNYPQNNFMTPQDSQNNNSNYQNNFNNMNNFQQNNFMIPQDLQNNNNNYQNNFNNMNNFQTNDFINSPDSQNNNNYNNYPNNFNNMNNFQPNNFNYQNMNQNYNMNNIFNPQMQQQQLINNQAMNFNLNNNISLQNNINNNFTINTNNITSLKDFNYVPKIGLVNLGQTCYMNSVLQCFSNLYPITNYFLNPKRRQFIKDYMDVAGKKEDSLLYFAYIELLDNLWKGIPNQPYSPKNFKKRLEKLNPLFAPNTPGDSKDFVNFFIMRLHEELNLIEQNPNAKFINNFENNDIDPFNENQVLNAFLSNFAQNQYSVISRYFYGITQGQFECQGCKMKLLQRGIRMSPIKYNFENFFFLEFPLDEVRKNLAEQNNMLAYYQNINQVNIYDCFNYYQKINTIIGYCEKCKIDNAQINSKNMIYSPSIILMLIFNRGKGIQFNIKIDFPEKLDISNIVIKNSNQFYELQGVVKHFGDNSSYGHFLSYCRSGIPMFHDNWYCFNDQTVVEANNWKDIVDNGDTYILFYELKNNNN